MRCVPTLSTTRDLNQPYAVPGRPSPHILRPAALVPAPDLTSSLFRGPRRANRTLISATFSLRKVTPLPQATPTQPRTDRNPGLGGATHATLPGKTSQSSNLRFYGL